MLVLQNVVRTSEQGVVAVLLGRAADSARGPLRLEIRDAATRRSPETRAQIMKLLSDGAPLAGLDEGGEVRRLFLAKALLAGGGGSLSAAPHGAAGLVFKATLPIHSEEPASAGGAA